MAFNDDEEESRIPGATEDDYAPAESEPTETPSRAPRFPTMGTNPQTNLSAIARYGEASQQFDIAERAKKARRDELARKRATNAAARKDTAETGAQYVTDETGTSQPVVDPDTGKQRYTPRTSEVRYDEKGRPFQVKTDQTGARTVEDPDKDAKYVENQDDPNDPYIYRETKATPWQAIDPEEGLKSNDKKLVAASARILHRRELEKIESDRSGINLRLKDPKRPKALSQPKRAELLLQREALSQPEPEPQPKPSLFGMGVNHQATAQARADWMAREQERTTQLAAVDQALTSDDERISLEQQSYDLDLRHKEAKDGGPAGFLKRRKADEAQKFANLPPEQASAELDARSQSIATQDQEISSASQQLRERSDALQSEMTRGVTAERAREIDSERASIERDAEALDASIANRNALVEDTQTGLQARNEAGRAKVKASRDDLRKQHPELSANIDQFDAADADFENRTAQAQAISDPAARQSALDALTQERESTYNRLEAELEIAANGGFPRSGDPSKWEESDKAAWAKLTPEKKKQFIEDRNNRRNFEDVRGRRKAISDEEFVQPENWNSLSQDEKKQQIADFQRNKEVALRGFDEQERQKGNGNIIGQLSGQKEGGFQEQLADQVGGRLKSALKAAGGAYASVGTGILDLATAGQAAFGRKPDETWTREASKAIQDFYSDDSEYKDAAFTKLTGVLASAHSFMAPGGLIGKALGGTARAMTIGSAISGAVVNGGQAYSEALDMGLSPAQSFARLAVGMGLGTTEAVGVGGILGKLDKLAKGGIKKFFTELLKQGVEEGGQEAFQKSAQDLADLFILDKDDPRKKTLAKIRDDAIESGLWGAAAGILFTGLVDAAHRRDRRTAGLAEDEPDKSGMLEGSGVRPEQVAAVSSQIDNWQPPTGLTPEDAQLERMAGKAAIKVISGQPIESLLAEERAALESKLPNKSPRMEDVNGTLVITDGQLDRLRQMSPETANMGIRDEATLRAQILSNEKTTEENTEGEEQPGATTEATGEGSAVSQGPKDGTPPVERGIIRPLTNSENTRAKAIAAVLKRQGADEKVAAAFGRHFVMQEGAASTFAEQRTRAIQAFEAAGGKDNGQQILTALATQGKLQRATVEETFNEAMRQTAEAGKVLNEKEQHALRAALPHLAPAIDRWREAFSRIEFTRGGHNTGGVAALNGGAMRVFLKDIFSTGNLNAIARDPSRAELLVNEEARHVVGRQVLAVIGKERGIKGATDDEIADNYAAEIWKQLPDDLKTAVSGIYSEGGTKSLGDYHMGHEFFRMLSQNDTSLEGGKLIHKGKVLTEHTVGERVLNEIRHYLRQLFSYFTDLSKSLKEDGASDDIIKQVETARAAIRDRIKEIQSSVVDRQSREYSEAYADQTARANDRQGKAGTQTAPGGPTPDGHRGADDAGRQVQAGDDRSGRDESKAIEGKSVSGSGSSQEAGSRPELERRIAELEAEKEERQAAEERAAERRNTAVQKRAERIAGRQTILDKVPEDAKAQASAVLDKMQIGAPSYVLGANRERLPAAYVAMPPGTVQTSHVGADFHKNPLYGGENTRPYHSDETEQNKVRNMAKAGALDEDAFVTDAKSAADGGPQIVLAIFNDTNGKLQVQAQTAGGNGREQGVNLASAEDQDRLSEAWRSHGTHYGLDKMPEGWRGYRFLGVYDLRDEAQNREYLQLVDKLNPNQGVVQDTAARADIDAALKIPVDRLANIPLTLSPDEARDELIDLIRDSEKLGLDRNLMAGLVKNPGQAQFYMQRVLLASAFRSKAIGEFFTSAQWANGHATVSGLIKAATSTALQLRQKGHGNIADAIGRTLERVTEYSQKGDKINQAIKRAAEQTEMGEDGPTINAIADALTKKVEFLPLTKRGIKPVNSEETIAGFEDFLRDLSTAVSHFSPETNMFGESDTITDTIERAIAVHFRKHGEPILAAGRAFNRPKRIRELYAKRQEEGLNRWESEELTQLEKSAGQDFMDFFHEVRNDDFKLEQQTEKGYKPPKEIQGLLLSSAAEPTIDRAVAAGRLLEKAVVGRKGQTYEESRDERPEERRRTESPERGNEGRQRPAEGTGRQSGQESQEPGRPPLRPRQVDGQGRDSRLVSIYGENSDYDALGLPILPESRLSADNPLLSPTTEKTTAKLLPESLAVTVLGLKPGTISRETLRKAIVDYFIAGGHAKKKTFKRPQTSAKPEAIMMGGGGGAGKTSILGREIAKGNIGDEGRVLINADEIREFLPEYDALNAMGDPRSSVITHEESSDVIGAEILRQALEKKLPIILDGTMKNQSKAIARAREFQAEGYTVKMLGVTIDPHEALVRAYIRGKHSNRYVPNDVLLGAHKDFNRALIPYLRFFGSNLSVYENTGTPVQLSHDDILSRRFAPVWDRQNLNPDAQTLDELLSSYGQTSSTGILPAGRAVKDSEDQLDFFAAPVEAKAYVNEAKRDGFRTKRQFAAAAKADLGIDVQLADDLFSFATQKQPLTEDTLGSNENQEEVNEPRDTQEPRASDRGGNEATGLRQTSESGEGREEKADGGIRDNRTSGPDRPTELSPEERNHVIADGDEVAPRGNEAKYRANLAAIKLVKSLDPAFGDSREATPEEKKILARYTGWGWAGEYFNADNPRHAAKYQELKDLLTPEQFDAAKASTMNAHYTAIPVIDAMWNVARRLGFNGGTILEPAGGIGHFFGRIPQDIAEKSFLRGVELDDVSASIFKHLYPQAEIQHSGFEVAHIPNNSVDLAISNVPFGNYTVPGARDYPKLLIHDYFFARGLDKVKPGGLAIFITSDGTMDKSDKRVRELLASKADLVGAIRLPNDAFAENAGTEVTTDILILRKKDGSQFQGEDWLNREEAGTATVDGNEQPIRINQYYVAHPEMALGRHSLEGTMYAAGDYALRANPGQNTKALLDQAISRLPENVMSQAEAPGKIDENANELADPESKEGSYLEKDGEFYQVIDGRLSPAAWLTQRNFGDRYEEAITDDEAAQRREIARDWFAVREVALDLINAEINPYVTDEQLSARRQALNRRYAVYKSKWGTLSKRFRHNEKAAFLEDDPEYPLMLALEKEDVTTDPDTGKKTYRFPKSDIFTKRIREPRTMPDRAKDVDDAISMAMGFDGQISPATIARLLDISEAEAKEKIIESGRAFENPATGLIETKERYLSGNVRQKLAEARSAVADNPEYQHNVKALEAAQPREIPISDIYLSLASRWIPDRVLSKFASHLFGTEATVQYIREANAYSVKLANPLADANTTTHGTQDMTGSSILTHALNGTEPEITKIERKNGEERRVRDNEATSAAVAKMRAMQREFPSWVKTTTETVQRRSVQETVEEAYNTSQNTVVAPSYDGDYLIEKTPDGKTKSRLPGLSDTVWLNGHRRSIVARVLQEGSAMMAHGVGSGKTFSQIVLAMEMRRLGHAKKPLIVVQKATIGQFAKSVREAYPAARSIVATEKTFARKNRRRFLAQIATGDYDMVIMTQPQFDRLLPGRSVIQQFFGEKLAALESMIRQARAAGGKRDPKTKELEAAKKRLEGKLKRMMDGLQDRGDDTLSFEQLGIDALLIDEAHAYKKASLITKLRRVKGIPNDESQRAMGLEMKAQYIQEKNNGRNVILATGTPITNSMAEAYIMLKLATPHVLADYNIENFDEFAHTFGQTQSKVEFGWGGKWKVATRFNKFVNGPELITMIRSGFDVKIGNKELGLHVPRQKGKDGADAPELIIIPQTPAMEAITDWIGSIAAEYDRVMKRGSAGEKEAARAVPIVTMQAGMAAAVDPRLIFPESPDDPGSKVNHAVKRIHEIWQETAETRGTQVVFADRFKPFSIGKLTSFAGGASFDAHIDDSEEVQTESTEDEDEQINTSKQEDEDFNSEGFNLYKDIREKLVAAGIPREQIAIIHEWNTDKRREELFERINAGVIRIVIGSTEKLGVGVNMQQRLVAAHHLDPPRQMTPAMMEQRDGRIIRQGNSNDDVWNIRYGVERSMDTGIYQMLENKGRFIAQALSGQGVGRAFEDAADEVTLSMAEMKALLTGDTRVLRMAELQAAVQELETERSGFENEKSNQARRFAWLKSDIAKWEKTERPRVEKDVEYFKANFGKDAPLKVKVDDKTYTEREDAVQAIQNQLEVMQPIAKRSRNNSHFKFIDVNGVKVQLFLELSLDGKSVSNTYAIIYSPTDRTVELRRTERNSGSGILQSVSRLASGYEGRITEGDEETKGHRSRMDALQAEISKKWDREDEYQSKTAELRAIEKSLLTEATRDDEQDKPQEDEGILTSGRAVPDSPDQMMFDYNRASQDGEKTALARFQEFLPEAMKIANSYRGSDADERRQQARIAVADAARQFKPEKGVPFHFYARAAVHNRMRSLLTREQRYSGPLSSLDEPVGEDGQETRGDFVADTSAPAAPVEASLSEARGILGEVISELPEKLQRIVDGYFAHETQSEIASDLGVSKERVSVLQDAAFRMLRGKLGERGISRPDALLSRPAEPSEDPIDTLLTELESEGLLDYGAIEGLQEQAAAEQSGKRETGRPDLAFGASSPDVMGVDAFYTGKFVPENEAEWRDQAETMLARDYDGTKKAIEFAGLSGQVLTPAQTKAADIIARDLRAKMRNGDPAARKAFNVFWYAYRSAGTAAGRALAARHDPLMRPAERYREFLTGMMLKPRPEAQKEIDAATTPEEKAKLIDKETQALLDKLRAAGITPEDILENRVSVRLQNASIVKEFVKGLNEQQQRAFRMIQQNRAFSDIAKVTGLSEDKVRQMKDAFVAKMRQQHFGKFKAGAKADQAEVSTGLFSGKAQSLWGEAVSDDKAEKEFQRWLGQLGMVENAKQGKPKFSIENPAHVMRMARAIQAATRSNLADMAYEYWIMNILSGPRTHVVNIAGNALNAAWDMTLQRGMESLVNLAVRDSKSARLGEFKWLMKGLIPGMAKGLSLGAKAWAAEHDFFEHTALGTPIEIDSFDKAGNVRAAIPGKVGRVVRIPGRALLFADSFFKTAIGNAEVGAHAYRMAKAEGLKGKQLSDRVALLSKTREQVIAENLAKVKPTEEAAAFFARELAAKDESLIVDDLVSDKASQAWELAREQAAFDMAGKDGWTDQAWQAAVAKARENTFQQDLKRTSEGGNMIEDVAAKLQDARNNNKLVGLFFPFVKTPYNIFRQGIRKSPFGSIALAANLAKGLYQLKDGKPYVESHPTAVRDVSEQLIAWALFALIYGAVQGDPDDEDKAVLITGSSPRNVASQGERELQQRAYGGDYVIRIGGRNGFTINFGRYEPFATVLGTTVDMIRAIKSRGATANNLDALWGYMTAQAQSKTFLQGFSDISRALEGTSSVTDGAKRFMLQAIVPNFIRQPLRNLDEHQRDVKHAQDLYQALPADEFAQRKADVYGKDIQKSGNPVLRLFFDTPLKADERLENADKLLLNWNRENPSESYAPQSPKDTYVRDGKEHKMDAEQYRRFTVAAGRLASINLRSLTPKQIAKPTKDDVDQIRKAFEDARTTIKKRMFPFALAVSD